MLLCWRRFIATLKLIFDELPYLNGTLGTFKRENHD